MIPIVSFYTENTPYEEEAWKMRESAYRQEIAETFIYPVESRGKWEANCQIKAEILLQACEDLQKPFLYVDSDARFRKQPHLFDLYFRDDYDLAVHYFRGVELLSGTIWVNPTIEVKGTIQEWIEFNKSRPNEWDQRNLDRVLVQSPKLRILRLPCEYCYIYDLSQKYYPDRDPVIVHYQASRKYKRRIT